MGIRSLAAAFLAACLATGGAWAAASARADEPDATTEYVVIDEAPSVQFLRFYGARPIEQGHSQYAFDRLLIVFLDDAAARPAGVSHVVIDRKMDCASHAAKTVSYKAFALDGTVTTRNRNIPRELEPSASGPAIDARWDFLCRIASGRPSPPMPRIVNSTEPPVVRLNDIGAAVEFAHKRKGEIDAAMHLPDEGLFMLTDFNPQRGAMFVDFSTLSEPGGKKRVSWLVVRNPSNPQHISYLRAAYSVDCEQQTTAREMVAQFDANDRLITLQGDAPPQLMSSAGNVGQFLSNACTFHSPRLFDRTYKTFTTALAAGRAKLQP